MRYHFILSDLRPGFCQAVLAKYQKKQDMLISTLGSATRSNDAEKPLLNIAEFIKK